MPVNNKNNKLQENNRNLWRLTECKVNSCLPMLMPNNVYQQTVRRESQALAQFRSHKTQRYIALSLSLPHAPRQRPAFYHNIRCAWEPKSGVVRAESDRFGPPAKIQRQRESTNLGVFGLATLRQMQATETGNSAISVVVFADSAPTRTVLSRPFTATLRVCVRFFFYAAPCKRVQIITASRSHTYVWPRPVFVYVCVSLCVFAKHLLLFSICYCPFNFDHIFDFITRSNLVLIHSCFLCRPSFFSSAKVQKSTNTKEDNEKHK